MFFSSELTTWSYQHSASIESTHFFHDDIKIYEYTIVSSILNPKNLFILILTNNHWIEIYSAKLLNQEPLFSFHLQSSARIHSTSNGNFYVLTSQGSMYSIGQTIISDKNIEFNQTANKQLQVQCSMMFSSVLTLNGLESMIILADNRQSLAIWTLEEIIYIDINISLTSSQLKYVSGERTENFLLLYFNNKTLISSTIDLNKSNNKDSVQLISFNEVDLFCLKKDCLAVYNNRKTQLNLHNLNSNTSYESIQLDKECQELCLNESATYVFLLLKSRVLFMYRIIDSRRLAKLFIYDVVSFMTADNEFLVLAMNDRRLLTLMIADPDDPMIQTKIKALPSRYILQIY